MLLQALCSISYPLVNSNQSYSPETPNLGQIRRFLAPCDLEIWRMSLKNNRAPLLSNIKLYVSFHFHTWIQTGVTVPKHWSWVVTSVTLTFELWPWPFAWMSLLSLVITPENFMMIRWWEHGEKGVTDGQRDGRTDGQTDWTIHRAAWSQLKRSKIIIMMSHECHGISNHWQLNSLFKILLKLTSKGASQAPYSYSFVRVIDQSSINSPHKGPVMCKEIPFYDIIMFPWAPFTNMD